MSVCSFRALQHPRNGKGKSPPATSDVLSTNPPQVVQSPRGPSHADQSTAQPGVLHPVQTGLTARLPLLRKRPPPRQLCYLFQPSFGPVRIERSIADNFLLPIPYPMHNNAISTPKYFSRRNYAELQYRVLIDDNAHYMDESERAARGVFGSATFAR
jgi:hypothetical protein